MKPFLLFATLSLTVPVHATTLRLGASTPARALVPLLEVAYPAASTGTRLVTEVEDTAQVIQRVGTGQIQVGVLTRNLKKTDREKTPSLRAHVIGFDALVVTVPASNPVQGLTGEQIRAIWSGRIRNWAEVGGPELAIHVLGRSKRYDPIQLFGDFMKLEAQFTADRTVRYRVKGEPAWSKYAAAAFESDDDAARALLADPGAVTYFPVAWLLRERQAGRALKGLSLDGVEATTATVGENGAYYLRRTLNVFTAGAPDAVTQNFITFLLGPAGQRVIADAGFLPATTNEAAPGDTVYRSGR